MTKPPLVDVAVATYNHEKFIAEAIESVLAQETDFEFRIIIGDDCSQDTTQTIIRDYARKNPKLITTLLYSEHLGIANKDRVGLRVLERCTAKYVALLDGDDYWTDRHKLQKQVQSLEQHPDSVICFHDVRIFYEDGSQEPCFCRPGQKKIFTIEDLLEENFMQTCSVMFRNNLIGKVPAWYHACLIGDWPLHVMVAQHGTIRYLDEVMAAYRIHGSGVWSAKRSTLKLKEGIKLLGNLNKYLGYKYDRRIKTTQSRFYEGLTKIYYQEGDRKQARNSFAKCLMLGLANHRLPSRNQLGRLLYLQNPEWYSLYRSMRDRTNFFCS